MTRSLRSVRVLLIVSGLLWGLAYFAMNAIGWGEPGSEEYRRYELFNRLLGIVIVVLAVSTAMLRAAMASRVPRFVRHALAIVVVAQAVMALGSALEFWLFTFATYAPGSLRGIGWGTYCLGLLIFYLAGAVFGAWLVRSRVAVVAGVAFLSWLPLAALLFGLGRVLNASLPALAPAVALSGFGYVMLGLRTEWARPAATEV
jgi:hypothetical protein